MHNPSTINKSTHLKDHAESILTKYPVRFIPSRLLECGQLHGMQCQNAPEYSRFILHCTASNLFPLTSSLWQVDAMSLSILRADSSPNLPLLRSRLWRTVERGRTQSLSGKSTTQGWCVETELFHTALQPGDWFFVVCFKARRLKRICSTHRKHAWRRHHWRGFPWVDEALPTTRSSWIQLGDVTLLGVCVLARWRHRYNDDLSWKIQASDVNVQSKGRRCEWSEEGLEYLYQVPQPISLDIRWQVYTMSIKMVY